MRFHSNPTLANCKSSIGWEPHRVDFHLYAAILHIHSSDGSLDALSPFRDLRSEARRQDIPIFIGTEHDLMLPWRNGWHEDVLVIGAEEVTVRKPRQHLLAIGLHETIPRCETLEEALSQAKDQGALTIAAHPHGYPPFHALDEVEGSEIFYPSLSCLERQRFRTPLYRILSMPGSFRLRVHPEDVQHWDQRTNTGHRFWAFAGSDVHIGGADARWLFGRSRQYILTGQPLTGQDDQDRHTVRNALQSGHFFIALHPQIPDGFAFFANDGIQTVTMGDTLSLDTDAPVTFVITFKRSAYIRLLRSGTVLAETLGNQLRYVSNEPGAYRAEVFRVAEPTKLAAWTGPWLSRLLDGPGHKLRHLDFVQQEGESKNFLQVCSVLCYDKPHPD